ncbi:MAG: isocitrate lyase/phosphoenolpyruvate mutase family protein [Sulfurifustaceae bacterium]
MNDQETKAATFKALHERDRPFLLPNPWDRGTALLLQHLGFDALGTTSLGLANLLGRKGVTKQQVLDNCRIICAATRLPVSADLENCFADDPRAAAETIREAYECGAVGASIEDWTRDEKSPIYDFHHAVERVHAAVEMARSLPVPFVLTARAENFLYGRKDLDDTIRRLQAYAKAGADVLYAPGLRSLDEIRTVAAAVPKPLNVVMGFADPTLTLDQLGAVGVRRISIGGALSRVALKSFLDAAREMRDGRFTFVPRMAALSELHAAFSE